MIDLNDIAKGFGSQQLFEDLNWQIRPGQRIGLIGPNGVGKSTLLKLIMGQIAPDHGSVRLAKNLRLGYLPQEIARIAGRTVREQASEGLAHIWALQAQLNAQEQRLGELRGAALEAALADYAQLQARFEQLGGFTASQRVQLAGEKRGPLRRHQRPLRRSHLRVRRDGRGLRRRAARL